MRGPITAASGADSANVTSPAMASPSATQSGLSRSRNGALLLRTPRFTPVAKPSLAVRSTIVTHGNLLLTLAAAATSDS